MSVNISSSWLTDAAMGDSDDEFERRRDKFRGERSEYPGGGPPPRDGRRMDARRGRDDYQDR